jgi:UDPglucose--hexose-1-phosphate uridylyltransferase
MARDFSHLGTHLPELRKDIITGRWVIIATERSKRPQDFRNEEPPPLRESFCPFCEGHESKTPPEVLAIRRNGGGADSPGWSLRVIPNKFPALCHEGDLDMQVDELFESMSGVGYHEVIIESPDHSATLAELSEGEVEKTIWAYRERILALQKDERIQYILVFKNHGVAAGASLEHSHSQLIALPIVPLRVRREIDLSRGYFGLRQRCVFCDVLAKERKVQQRLIAETDCFIAMSPYAARFPFETWILTKAHQSQFELTPPEQHAELATLLKKLLGAMNVCLAQPAYNFLLHTAPVADRCEQTFHWHLEVIPRLTRVAGFEWGSGFYINPTTPEMAAESLRVAIETGKAPGPRFG